MRVSLIGRVAREELTALSRSRVALTAGFILAALIVAATLLGVEQRNAIETARAGYQAASAQAFDAQPDRHPHRMVHYGQYVFRPLTALAFFDPGVDSYTGNTVFLEGHRQNSANFAEARQSSLLLRFGQLTPAFVLQTLAPLLIVFLAFGSVARERERGTLRLLLAQGLRPGELIAGKALAHLAVAGVIGLPAAVALMVAVAMGWAPPLASLLLALAYGLYLAIWALGSVLASSITAKGRDALTVLVSVWMVTVVLLPRTLPEVAAAGIDIPTRIETDVAIARELKSIGDSHNPDDPHFAAFKARTLAQYGVATTDELPVQWAGLVGMEGERLTSGLFDRHASEAFARERRQNDLVRLFGAISPVISLRQASMTLAGTDVESHQDFLSQVERFRYTFVQALNLMQVRQIPNVNAGDDPRIAAGNWKTLPGFNYVAPDTLALGAGRLALNIGILALWLVVLAGLCVPASRRLGRLAR
jgi:ABC-2 type transport system permease protein